MYQDMKNDKHNPEHNAIEVRSIIREISFRERPHCPWRGGHMKSRIIIVTMLAAIMTLGIAPPSIAGCESPSMQFEWSSRHAWLGVSLQDVTPKLAKKKNLKTEEGAYVNDVVRKSPADSAGIQEGDVIVEFNGRQIYDADDMVKAVRREEVGAKAKITVMRDGQKKELSATLKKSPRRHSFFGITPPTIPNRIMIFRGRGMMGLGLMELNPQLGKYFEAPEGKGVLVEKVEEGSAAEKAGFKAGDVILKVGEKNVESIRDVRRQLSKYDDGDKVSIEVLRKGARQTLSLEIEDGDENDLGYGFETLPSPEGLRDFDFHFEVPNFDRQMDKIRLKLDDAKRKLEDSKHEIEEKVRKALDKAKVAMQRSMEELVDLS
jgi:membrane-associated protease RseP (regulator of RpoE activity)